MQTLISIFYFIAHIGGFIAAFIFLIALFDSLTS